MQTKTVMIAAASVGTALDVVLLISAVATWIVRGHVLSFLVLGIAMVMFALIAFRAVYALELAGALQAEGARGTASGGTMSDPRWHRRNEVWPLLGLQFTTVLAALLWGSTLVETPKGHQPWFEAFWEQTSTGQRVFSSFIVLLWMAITCVGWAQSIFHGLFSEPTGPIIVQDAEDALGGNPRAKPRAKPVVWRSLLSRVPGVGSGGTKGAVRMESPPDDSSAAIVPLSATSDDERAVADLGLGVKTVS